MYVHRLLYVLSGVLLVIGTLALPGVRQTAVTLLPYTWEVELEEVPLLALFGGALATLFIARTLQLLTDIRNQLYRIENELSDFDGYPM